MVLSFDKLLVIAFTAILISTLLIGSDPLNTENSDNSERFGNHERELFLEELDEMNYILGESIDCIVIESTRIEGYISKDFICQKFHPYSKGQFDPFDQLHPIVNDPDSSCDIDSFLCHQRNMNTKYMMELLKYRSEVEYLAKTLSELTHFDDAIINEFRSKMALLKSIISLDHS